MLNAQPEPFTYAKNIDCFLLNLLRQPFCQSSGCVLSFFESVARQEVPIVIAETLDCLVKGIRSENPNGLGAIDLLPASTVTVHS